MKKRVLLVLFFVMGIVAGYSQNIHFNVKGGIGIANLSGDANGNALFSYKLGVGAEYKLANNWSIQPSLLFVRKGMTSDTDVSIEGYNVSAEATMNAYYLEVPIMAAYRVQLDDMNIVLNVGPYLAYGIAGKTKAEGKVSGYKESYEINTFGGDALNRFDFGLGLGAAFEFGRIVAGIEGNFGLIDVIDDASAKNMTAHITIGYKF